MWSILFDGKIIWSITAAISNFFKWLLGGRRVESRSSGVLLLPFWRGPTFLCSFINICVI